MNLPDELYGSTDLTQAIPLANASNLRIHPLSQEGEHAYA